MKAAISIPGVPRDADGPVFREPWEAQAFAMTLALYERGLFTWPEWAATLADEIKRAQAARRSRHRRDLLPHWLNALERLVARQRRATIRRHCNATATPGITPATARRTASRSSYAQSDFARLTF